MVNSDEIAGEITAVVKDVFGPSIWEEAVALAQAERVVQRLGARELELTNTRPPAETL